MLQKQSSDLSGLKHKRVYFLFKLHMQQETLWGHCSAVGVACPPGHGWWAATSWYYGKWKIQLWRVSHEQYMPNLEVIQFTGGNSDILNHRERGSTSVSHGWKAECETYLVSSNNDYNWLWGTTLVLAPERATIKPSAYTVTSERSGGSRDRETSQMFWWYKLRISDTQL